jgi:predicted  nucleic acid-binding Zn-ribbon protein
MEALALLEKKVSSLIELVKSQRESCEKLQAEKLALENYLLETEVSYKNLQEQYLQLQQTVENLETSLLSDKQKLDQEKELTQLFVDGLLKNIDSITQSE